MTVRKKEKGVKKSKRRGVREKREGEAMCLRGRSEEENKNVREE